MPTTFAIITPPLPAALGLIRVWGEGLQALFHKPLPRPGDPAKFVRFGDVDEGLICAEAESTWLLTTHGGAGVADGLRELFARAGFSEIEAPKVDDALAQSLNAHQRQALALLPTTRAAAGRALLLDAINSPHSPADSSTLSADELRAIRVRLTPPSIALIGAPNAGKSSLFNALATSADAIISDVAGTTRDALHAELPLADGCLADLFDTPGLRDAKESQAERAGISIGARIASKADLILLLIPADSDEWSEREAIKRELIEYLQSLNPSREGKLDLADAMVITQSKSDLRENSAPSESIAISVNDPASIAQLSDAIQRALFPPLPAQRALPLC